MTRFIFITGGVVSSLGKGLSAAALGALLQARGFKVRLRKLDPYLNVDPGTMSPYQHGEVYVTDDGAETDLDLGHYERYVGVAARRSDSVTTGRIYSTVIGRERRGVDPRSEEHTSELQSPCNLVCRLLLEKKKQNHTARVDIRRQPSLA